ncbi:class I adenylate-forming enzyme family protein [Gulosibacter molinativorax]|uniref:Long-chain fatty acid--CoA ligase n=1 Tax=Gulosibacter molinativorax TaxID=256821 RepID=A0ABT7CAI5_9MICO|nr:class I adenylate-forming enzyme family protein [Gulosibacter molinativorax]MDJ1372204.1 long-chain fatty acid--CoA ligase [Gulosibacter molinativorax]QUY60923.1 Putative acyl--CoA ligase YhfT [Gulosibacter molinativorax]
MPITRTILEVAATHPDRLAIVGDHERLTYRDLVADGARVRAAVEHLQARQPKDARPVPAPEAQGIPITAISLTDAFHTARILAGLAGFRAVSATIDPRWPLEHQVGIILKVGIGLVISDSVELREALAQARWTGTIVTLAEFLALEDALPPAGAPEVRDPDEAFLLLFSSGTTSAPKAFMRLRHEYRYNAKASSHYLEASPGVATLAPGPLSYSLTLFALVECLYSCGTCHVADQFDVLRASRRIGEERISRVVAVPAVIQGLAEAAKRDPQRLSSLKLAVTGGANLSAQIRDAFATQLPGSRLISYYGAAEIGFIGDSRDSDGTKITLYDGVEAEIRDGAGLPLADGEVGTLWIRVASTALCYVASTTDAQLRGEHGWATVHDQGSLNGRKLTLVGRSGDIVVSGGHKISLPEVERAFHSLPGAEVCCAVGVPHERLGAVVALVLEGNAVPGKAELLAHAREQLAPQFVPRRFYRIDSLPRTVGGKIRRAETAALLSDGEADAEGLIRL